MYAIGSDNDTLLCTKASPGTEVIVDTTIVDVSKMFLVQRHKFNPKRHAIVLCEKEDRAKTTAALFNYDSSWGRRAFQGNPIVVEVFKI